MIMSLIVCGCEHDAPWFHVVDRAEQRVDVVEAVTHVLQVSLALEHDEALVVTLLRLRADPDARRDLGLLIVVHVTVNKRSA